MPCKNWNVEWVAHLYGELESAEERRMSEHLEGCAECRQTLENLRDAREMLGELAPVEATVPRVVVLQRPRLRRPVWAFAAGVACATVLFAVGALAGASWPSGPLPVDPGSAITERQQDLETRFASLEESLAGRNQAPMTRPEIEQALRQMERRLEVQQARNTQFLLEEINATEFRAGRWVDETRQAIQFVALQNDPRFRER